MTGKERVQRQARVLRLAASQLCERIANFLDEAEAEAMGAVERSALDRQESARRQMQLSALLGMVFDAPPAAPRPAEWDDLLDEVRDMVEADNEREQSAHLSQWGVA